MHLQKTIYWLVFLIALIFGGCAGSFGDSDNAPDTNDADGSESGAGDSGEQPDGSDDSSGVDDSSENGDSSDGTDVGTDSVVSIETDSGDVADSGEETDTGDDSDTREAETDTISERDTFTDDDTDTQETAPRANQSLAPVQDCDAAWTILREKFVDDMKVVVERNRQVVLEHRAMSVEECDVWNDDYYSDTDGDTDSDADTDADGDGDGDGDGDEEDGADEYSTTNNQVEGVDEADFLKNDGSYIYILADGAFQIVDAWPAAEARVVSRTPIEGVPKKLFVYDSKAFVYSSLTPLSTTDANFNAVRYGSGECTYGYDCDFVGDGRDLKITVLDISDVTTPKVIRETNMNGSYLNARRIGNVVYTVVVFPELLHAMPNLRYIPLGVSSWECGEYLDGTAEELNAAFDRLIEENIAAIDAFDFEATLPTINDRLMSNGQVMNNATLRDDCSRFNVARTADGYNLITVLGLNLETFYDYTLSSVVSRPGAIYADGDSLYLAMRHYRNAMPTWFYSDSAGVTEATTIHKFALDNDHAQATYQGSGVVKGRILNQFAMDEYEGHLRVATTNGHVPSPDVHSTLSVLDAETGGDLTLTGQIDNIAPTEDIRSARFNGDRGFVVTFKKTDPLFVFDLSNPAEPSITGELKIPGYSTYMHLMDDTHILSIGFDAEDAGTRAYFQGIQLQILDITDVANPTLLHREVIGTRGSTSDAATDHLAFNYFKSFDQLAIPMVVCEESSGGSDYGDVMTFSGLMVYNVTVENGFTYLGGIPHGTPEVDGYQTGVCNNWWSSGNSQVKRSIFMDEYVYSIAPDLINVSDVSDLAHPVSSVTLVTP